MDSDDGFYFISSEELDFSLSLDHSHRKNSKIAFEIVAENKSIKIHELTVDHACLT